MAMVIKLCSMYWGSCQCAVTACELGADRASAEHRANEVFRRIESSVGGMKECRKKEFILYPAKVLGGKLVGN
jgi:hypothetical protein